MNAVPFDTLKMARKLESAGFTGAQAAGAAEAMADAMSGAELATKADVQSARSDLQTEIKAVRSDLHAEIKAVRSDLQAVKSELENKIDRLDAKIEIVRRDMTIRLGAMLAGSTGIILAALRLMPH